jgi:hypothetical protein
MHQIFGFYKNQNNPEIISYHKPLARQFDEVKCPKHKSWWFVVRNNLGIVSVFSNQLIQRISSYIPSFENLLHISF